MREAVQLTEQFTPVSLYGWDDRSFALYLYVVGLLIAFLVSWWTPERRWVRPILAGVLILAPLALMKLGPVRQVVIPWLRWIVS